MSGPRTSRAATRRGPAPRAATVAWARALLALVVLVAFVIGIPIALVMLRSPALHELGDVHRIAAALTAPDDGRLFLAVLTVAAWVGWLTFALAVVLEIPAQLRGVPVVHLRGLGVQQSVAGGLVATALAVVLLPWAAVAAEHPASTSAVAVARPVVPPALRGASSPAGARVPVVDDTPAADRGDVYVVQRGDTLWDIAAARLGDGTQWRRIAALNYDRDQPDGRQLDPSHQLLPGWRLVLPAREHPSGGREDEDRRTRVVRPGDTLSGIAAEELGSADRWPEIARASAGIVEPGGQRLTDPDKILPGWSVRIPERSSPASAASGPSARTPARHSHSGSTKSGEESSPSVPLDPSWTADAR